MAQIKQSCSVTNGSQTVTTAGDLTQRIKKNHIFMIEVELVPYTVAADSTYSNTTGLTTVVLTGNYQGSTNATAAGVFAVDMTYPDMVPTIAQGDVGTAAIFTQSMYRLQDMVTSVSPGGLLQYSQYWTDVNAWHADVNTWHTDVATWYGDVSVWHADVSTWHDDTLAARNLAQNWASQLTTTVDGTSYSAKQYALNSIASATLAQNFATSLNNTFTGAGGMYGALKYANDASASAALANSWATSMSIVSGGLYGAQYYATDASASAATAKNWATQLTTEVVAGQGYSARQYAANAGNSASAASGSATTALNWASQLTTTVDGTSYSAKQYALNAGASATTAQNWATSTSIVSGGFYGAYKYATDASASATLAQAWAAQATGVVNGTASYSAAYYAGQAGTSAGNASTSATTAQSWATSLAVVSGGLYGALKYANDASASATKAQNWATQAAGEVVAGQGYSAYYWAQQAANSASQASAGQIPSDWNQTDSAQKDFIKNKPNLNTVYPLPNNASTSGWMKLGTFTVPGQAGHTIKLGFTSHSGFNSSTAQSQETVMVFKTANNTSFDTNGFAGDGYFYTIGINGGQLGAPGAIKVKADAPGAGARNYDVWINQNVFEDNSFYSVSITPWATWTHVAAPVIGQADPGAASSTICVLSAIVPSFSGSQIALAGNNNDIINLGAVASISNGANAVGINLTPVVGGSKLQINGGANLNVGVGSDAASSNKALWVTKDGGTTYNGFAWQYNAAGGASLLVGNGSSEWVERMRYVDTTGFYFTHQVKTNVGMVVDHSAGERHYEWSSGTFNGGFYCRPNDNVIGLYDWTNSRGVWSYTPASNRFDIACPMMYVDSFNVAGSLAVQNASIYTAASDGAWNSLSVTGDALYKGVSDTVPVVIGMHNGSGIRLSANSIQMRTANSLSDQVTIGSTGTTTFSGTRTTTLNSAIGVLNFKGDSSGWAMGMTFQGSGGTQFGGFYGNGTGDTCTNYSIGDAYNSNQFVVAKGTTRVYVGKSTDNGSGSVFQTSGGISAEVADGATALSVRSTTYSINVLTVAASANGASISTPGSISINANGGAGSVNINGALNSQNINFNRQTYQSSGIRWYNSTSNAWVDYMACVGQTNTGPNGNLTPPSGTLVTQWAKRSFIENVTGYGWTFESGAQTSTTPAVVAEISSVDGSARFAGSVTAGNNLLSPNAYLGNTGAYSGSGSTLSIRYTGAGSQYGITMKPDSTSQTTVAINFLASNWTAGAPTYAGAIQQMANDAGMNLSGTWNLNNNVITHWGQANVNGGFPSLSAYNIILKNSSGAVSSEIASAATAARTWTMPDKSGTVAMTSDISGGSLVPLGKITLAGNTFVDFLNTFTDSYDKYIIEVENVAPSAAGSLNLRTATGGTVNTGTSYTGLLTPGGTGSVASTSIVVASGAASGAESGNTGISLTIEILNARLVTDAARVVKVTGAFMNQTAVVQSVNGTGANFSTNPLTGIRLYWNSVQTFTKGVVRVYGVLNN